MTRLQLGAIGGLIFLSACIGAFFFGRSTGIDKMNAQYLGTLQHALVALQASQARVDAAEQHSAELEGRRQSTVREIYRDIPRIVQGDPVYRNSCISDDGVRALDRAAAAANGDNATASPGRSGATAAGPADGGPGDGQGQH